MRTFALTTITALGAAALPVAAQAQDAPATEVTVGASVGLHDLGFDLDDFDGGEFGEGETGDLDIDDSGEIYGGFVAVDFPVGGNFFAGLEANAHFGSGPIDAEYGASARLGIRTNGGAKIYARGGYQWIDIDANNLVGLGEDVFTEGELGISTTVDDYLVGVGVEVPVSSVVLRANVDSVSFDTLRGSIGVGLKF